MTRNGKLSIIYGLSAALAAVICIVEGVGFTYDSQSYVDAWDYLNFYWRTPTYPLLVGLMKIIFGKGFLWGVIAVQNLVFLLSLRYLYDLLLWTGSSERTAFWLTLLYGVHPGILCWNNYIMTEYLAVSLTIFIVWEVKAILEGSSWKSVLLLTVFLSLLVFLRPAQIYFLPVLLLVFFAMSLAKKSRKQGIKGLSGVLLTSLLALFYCGIFQAHYGVFAPSGVGIENQYYIGRQHGLITPGTIRNRDMAEFLAQYASNPENYPKGYFYKEMGDVRDRFGIIAIRDEVRLSRAETPEGWILAAWERLKASASERLLNHGWLDGIREVVGIRISAAYLFLILFGGFIVVRICRKRQVPWFTLTVLALVIANCAVTVLGAQNDWARLDFPSTPLLFILIGLAGTMMVRPKSVSS